MRLRADSGRFAARAWRIGTAGETRCSTMVRYAADLAHISERPISRGRCSGFCVVRRPPRREELRGRNIRPAAHCTGVCYAILVPALRRRRTLTHAKLTPVTTPTKIQYMATLQPSRWTYRKRDASRRRAPRRAEAR